MRHLLVRSALLITLAVMFGGQVTELFDRWDHTLQTGKDTDYTLVVVAACAGLAFVLARKSVSVFGCATNSECLLTERSFTIYEAIAPEQSPAGPSPPSLLPLRI